MWLKLGLLPAKVTVHYADIKKTSPFREICRFESKGSDLFESCRFDERV